MVQRRVTKPRSDLAAAPRGRLPGIDALRALAILLILAEHARGAYLEAHGAGSLLTRSPVVRGGWSGIDLLFTLGGYLAGVALWRELAARGTVDANRFVLRRGLRLWPLYFAFYFFALLLVPEARHPGGLWWPDLTFTTNYAGHGLMPGSWLFCTAQQLCLLAPLVLVVQAPRIEGYRRYLIGALLLLPVSRAITWWTLAGGLFHHDSALFVARLYQPLHLHADGILVGLLLANVTVGEEAEGRGRFAWSIPSLLAVAAGFGALALVQREVFTFSAVAWLAGAGVRYAVQPVTGAMARLALPGSRVIRALARLSFGMYLNHRYLEDAVSRFFVAHVPLGEQLPGLHFALTFAGLVIASALVAAVTFFAVERPFLKVRAALYDDPPRG